MTAYIDAGDWNGVLHVPMLQDPLTGRCEVQPGTTEVKGTVQRMDRARAVRVYSEYEHPSSESFVAKFTREKGKPLHNFELGYETCYNNEEFGVQLHVVLAGAPDRIDEDRVHSLTRSSFVTVPFNAKSSSDKTFKVKGPKRSAPDADDSDDYEPSVSSGGGGYNNTFSWMPGDESKYRRHLEQWEQHAGGILQVYARSFLDLDLDYYPKGMVLDADYKIKLYTVLSCHKPNKEEAAAAAAKREVGVPPDWDALEQLLAARFPKKPKAWAARAVGQYQLFLELKMQHDDWDSLKFSPSAALDDVWHAHLAFVDRYQQDVYALTGGARLIEHSPVLGDDAR